MAKGWRSISSKLLAAMLLVAFIPLLLIFFYFVRLTSQALELSINNLGNKLQKAHHLAQEAGTALTIMKTKLDEISALSQLVSGPKETTDEILKGLTLMEPGFQEVFLLDKSGNLLLSLPAPPQEWETRILITLSRLQGKKEAWVLSAAPPGHHYFLFTASQTRNERILVGKISLASLFKGLATVAGPTGVVYLVNQDGKVILGASSAHPALPVPKAGVQVVEEEYARLLRAFIPMPESMREIDIYLVLEHPYKEIDLALAQVHRRTGLAFLIAATLAIVAVLILANTLTTPLLLLTNQAAILAAGELSTPVPQIRTGDEIEQLATTLERTRIALKQKIEEISMLYQIASITSSTLELDTLLHRTLEEVKQKFGAESAIIYLASGETLTVRADTGLQVEKREIRSGEGVSGRVLSEGRSLLIQDYHEFDPHSPHRSIMAVPLRGQEKLLGTMEVHHTLPRQFSEERLKLLEVIASQVSMAVQNAALYERTSENLEKRVKELEGMYNASQIVSASLHLPKVLDKVVELVYHVLQADSAAITLYDKEKEIHKIQASRGLPEEFVTEFVQKPGEGLAGRVLASGEPLWVEDLDEETRFDLPFARRLKHKGIVAVPIVVDSLPIGTIIVSFKAPHPFSHEDERVLFSLANDASVAIKNARLYSQVREEKELLGSVLHSMSDGIITVNEVLEVTSVNPAAERILGFKGSAAIGRHICEVVQSTDPLYPTTRERCFLAECLIGRGTSYYECPVKIADGNVKTISFAPSLLEDQVGYVQGLVLLLRDISKIKEMEQMKSDFISTVSHELRTPLTSIKGYIATLLHPAANFDAAAMRDFLQIMNKEADRLGSLIGDLLEVSRIESQTLQLTMLPTSLHALLKHTTQRYQGTSQKHEFLTSLPSTSLMVNADMEQLGYVVSHLLSNAVKYSPKGGKVRVKAWIDESLVHVSVEDEGVGVPPGEEEKIFDRFYRIDNRPTRWAYGWGLGLFIARKIIEAHSGKIWVESLPERGSRFTFTIPLLEEARREEVTQTAAEQGAK